MARSRYVEQKSQINQALRATRRVYRKADTQGEKLERTLDRLIQRKTAVYADQLSTLVAEYRAYYAQVSAMEGSLTQLIQIASY